MDRSSVPFFNVRTIGTTRKSIEKGKKRKKKDVSSPSIRQSRGPRDISPSMTQFFERIERGGRVGGVCMGDLHESVSTHGLPLFPDRRDQAQTPFSPLVGPTLRSSHFLDNSHNAVGGYSNKGGRAPAGHKTLKAWEDTTTRFVRLRTIYDPPATTDSIE